MADSALLRTRYRVGGMDCAACANKIETAVSRLPGIAGVDVSHMAGTMSVSHEGAAPTAAISHAVKWLGYTLHPADQPVPLPPPARAQDHAHNHDHEHDHDREGGGGEHFELEEGPWWKSSKATLASVSAMALGLAFGLGLVLPQIGHWAFVGALLVGLVSIGRRAIAGAFSGTPFSIETLMTIAAVGAVIIGATEEAATVVLLFLVGELLEGVAARRARSSIRKLTEFVPKTAFLEDNGQTKEVPADSLAIRSIIIVRPGDRIPADGEIIEGSSSIDESPVTGESAPTRKSVGEQVFAGTINADAVLRVRVTAAAADNTIARVVKLVEEAQESKAPTERFTERFSKIYTPGVLVIGALVAVVPPLLFEQAWSEWFYKGLAVLLIGCPCALVISTPAAIAAGLSAGAKRGLLLKGGAVLEGLRHVTAVAFDKTGTLTEGKPVVTDIVAIGRSEQQVLSLAAALETGSSHPLALAILTRAVADKTPIPPSSGSKALGGKGVVGKVGGEDVFLASPHAASERAALTAEESARIAAFNDDGKTVSVLLVGSVVVGLFAIRDEARSDAASALKALRDSGIAIVMLTGDNARTANAIGKGLGIDVRAELLPDDKQRIVREMQAQGKVVAKVGDGINDAPALAAADIGIAMGGGTDVALETADAASLHGRVADVASMIDLSHSVMGNITQNIAVALGLKVVFLVTTIVGITGLWPAILADTGATVLVTANAMRLLTWNGGKARTVARS